jgi:hypothetical protein
MKKKARGPTQAERTKKFMDDAEKLARKMYREQQKELGKITIALTKRELGVVIEALDSHVYWQLSDQYYRNNCEVTPPGSKNPEMVREIRFATKLHDMLVLCGK